MKKLLYVGLALTVFLFLVALFLPSQITHLFCALDQTCTWTGTQTFSGISSLNSIQFVDGITNATIQAAINKLPGTGGLVYIPASSSEYACPSSIPSNVGIVGLTPFADNAFIGNINPSPDITNTQVWIGPCSSITVAAGAQNIRLSNLTLDYNFSGNGLSFTSISYLHLSGVTIRNAGNSVTPALSLLATNGNGNMVHPMLENVNILCNTVGFCSAGIYLNAGTTTAVTNGQFTNLSIAGNVKCGIQLEQNTDTNRFIGGNLQASTWVSGSAPFCFNLNNPTVDTDADASEFFGVGVTGSPTYGWNAGQSQGHIFVGLNSVPPNTTNFHVAGGTPLYPMVLMGGGGTGAVFLATDEVQLHPGVYASLPACSATYQGQLAAVTDSNTVTWGANIAGSSSSHVLAYCDGTNWTVAGK